MPPDPSEDEAATEGDNTPSDKESGVIRKTEAVEATDDPERRSEQNHGDEAVEQRRPLGRWCIFFGGVPGVCGAVCS
jgi:hypothetical protein